MENKLVITGGGEGGQKMWGRELRDTDYHA